MQTCQRARCFALTLVSACFSFTFHSGNNTFHLDNVYVAHSSPHSPSLSTLANPTLQHAHPPLCSFFSPLTLLGQVMSSKLAVAPSGNEEGRATVRFPFFRGRLAPRRLLSVPKHKWHNTPSATAVRERRRSSSCEALIPSTGPPKPIAHEMRNDREFKTLTTDAQCINPTATSS